MADIRIDRYDVDVTSDGQTQTITDVGSTSSAFIRIIGTINKSSAGRGGNNFGDLAPDSGGIRLELTATNEVTFHINTPLTPGMKVMFEVVVYTGPSGGAYEFIVRQRGSVTITNGNSSASASISGVTDRNDCIPFYTGYETDADSVNDYYACVLACHINSSTNVVFSRNNTGSGHSITAGYTVVEFTGSSWSVGHAVSTSHDADDDLVTMNTDSTGTGGSTFNVTDWDTAWIIECTMEGDSAETGIVDIQGGAGPGTSTTTVYFSIVGLEFTSLDNGARNDGSAYIHILQCDDLNVYRNFEADVNESANAYQRDVAWPTGAPTTGGIDVLAMEWFSQSTGTGTAHLRGSLHAQIVDDSGYVIEHWVHRSGNVVDVRYGVVDLAALEDLSASGQIKVWTGAAFEAKPVKVWNGSSWEIKPVKHWNGSSWVETNY